MNLTKEEKADLKSLTEHRGFKLLEKIYEDKRAKLFTKFETVNLWEGVNMAELAQAQNFNSWMKSIINTAKWLTAEKVDKVESLR